MAYRFACAVLVWGATTIPALAGDGIAIPEPSDPWLFGLGVVGLLVGRHASRRKPPR